MIFLRLEMGIKEILSHKLRSFLTILGIILGVASLISLFAIVDGAKQKTLEYMREVGGLQKVAILSQELSDADRLKINRSKDRTYDDALALQSKASLISLVSPEVEGRAFFEYKKKRFRSAIYGVTQNMLYINKYEVGRGRYITDWDIDRNARVIVLGTRITDELFKNEDPLGKKLFVNGQYFTIVGILKRYEMWYGKRNALDWKNNWASMPITTMQKRFTGSEKVTYLNISVDQTDKLNDALQQAKNILLKRHYYMEDFKFDTKEESLAMIKQNTDMWTVVLGGIGLISLLVGGIGIMNIMLASVTERTREIGIRRAIGAKRGDILSQFLAESTMLSIIGGVLGILVALLFITIISQFPEQTPLISFDAVFFSFAFSVLVGLFFGVYPALRAANLNPIEALRYE